MISDSSLSWKLPLRKDCVRVLLIVHSWRDSIRRSHLSARFRLRRAILICIRHRRPGSTVHRTFCNKTVWGLCFGDWTVCIRRVVSIRKLISPSDYFAPDTRSWFLLRLTLLKWNVVWTCFAMNSHASVIPDAELLRLQAIARHYAAEYCVRVLRERGVPSWHSCCEIEVVGTRGTDNDGFTWHCVVVGSHWCVVYFQVYVVCFKYILSTIFAIIWKCPHNEFINELIHNSVHSSYKQLWQFLILKPDSCKQ